MNILKQQDGHSGLLMHVAMSQHLCSQPDEVLALAF